MTTEQTTLAPGADINMTFRVGTLYLSPEILREALGKPPHIDPNEKVNVEWILETPNGVATVYDYWWNGPGEFSIGGYTASVVEHVQAFIAERIGFTPEAHKGMPGD